MTSPIKAPVRVALRAFTVLEVMFALGIFALAAVVLGASYLGVLTSYEAAARSTELDEDLRFARQLLLSEPDRKKAEEGGDFEGLAGRRIRWQATIEETSLPDLFLVTFSCEASGGTESTKQGKRSESFRVLRPTWSEPAERDKLREKTRQRIEEFNGAQGIGNGALSAVQSKGGGK